MLFYFEKESKSGPNSEILHNWKAYLTLEIVKQDKCPNYSWLFPAYYCVQQFTVSNKILCLHLLLIYTFSTFPCQHAAVVSCFPLYSPLFVNKMNFVWTILSQWYLTQSKCFDYKQEAQSWQKKNSQDLCSMFKHCLVVWSLLC